MISHLSLGVANLKKSVEFYDHVLKTLGYKRLLTGESFAAYGNNHPMFWINLPLDQKRAASAGNGTHVSFVANTQNDVESFYHAALDNGATDAGPPGFRPEYAEGYFAAFVYDLDGHKIEADYFLSPENEGEGADISSN